MGKLKFKILPSAILFAAAMVSLGKGILLLGYFASVLLHEAAHYFVARKYYFKCVSLELSAFGAVLYGDFEEEGGKAQIFIALAGPLTNIALCIIFVAFWYIVPDSYVYTLELVYANAFLAFTNLLPCYPLDGGKVLCAIVQERANYQKALAFTKVFSVIISGVMFLLFFFAFALGYNLFSLGLFAVFLMLSSLSGGKEKIYGYLPPIKQGAEKAKRGVERRILVVARQVSLAQASGKMSANCLYEVEVVDEKGETIAYFDSNEWNDLLLTFPPKTTFGQILTGNTLLK